MPSLTQATEKFIKHCRYSKSLSPHTIRAYTQDLSDFLTFAGQRKPLATIDKAFIESYVQDVRKRLLSSATTKRRIACLKVFFLWLESTEVICETPFLRLKLKIKQSRRLPRAINRQDLRRLVRQASRTVSSTIALSTDLAILLMATTGVRVAELVSLKIQDIDTSDGSVRVHGKGSRERTVFVTNLFLLKKLRSHVVKRKQQSNSDAHVFLNQRGRPLTTSTFRAHLRKASDASRASKPITPHMLRHTAATLLLEEGVDIRVVQRLLGHQSISTTEIYAHVADMTLRRALVRADLAAKIS